MTPDASPLFVLVAGEASGDLLGAGLIAGLRERFPGARFAGIGGPQMAAAGMAIWHPAETLSVMGLVEVLRHLPRLLAIRRDACKRTLRHPPAVFIGIDAPDFNLGLERKLKRAGIRTVHYVSPSIWAWRESRAARIGTCADRVLCLFPMEPPIYARHGVEARFVGHPLADAFPLEPGQDAARAELGLPADAPVLALLPGSRLGEIRRMGPDFLGAAAILNSALPDLRIVAPMANARCRAVFSALAPLPANLSIIDGKAHAAMMAADAVLLASGTAALEAMLAKRPMVVAYKLAPLTHCLVKRLGLLRTDVFSLPNILAGKRLVPELMQDACTPAALAAALLPSLRSRALPADLRVEFRRLHESLRGGGSRAAAAAIAQLCAASAGAHVQPL
ncbi:MAG: lipid-A-disaccharide synthase [Proteobacteria bacterium]|nr:lipid-A-disaccharide synthase [Pseudomonadota bacterium]